MPFIEDYDHTSGTERGVEPVPRRRRTRIVLSARSRLTYIGPSVQVVPCPRPLLAAEYETQTAYWHGLDDTTSALVLLGLPRRTADRILDVAAGTLRSIYDVCGPYIEANVFLAGMNGCTYKTVGDQLSATFAPLVHWQVGGDIPFFPKTILELLGMSEKKLDYVLVCLGDRPLPEGWCLLEKRRRLGRRWIDGFDTI